MLKMDVLVRIENLSAETGRKACTGWYSGKGQTVEEVKQNAFLQAIQKNHEFIISSDMYSNLKVELKTEDERSLEKHMFPLKDPEKLKRIIEFRTKILNNVSYYNEKPYDIPGLFALVSTPDVETGEENEEDFAWAKTLKRGSMVERNLIVTSLVELHAKAALADAFAKKKGLSQAKKQVLMLQAPSHHVRIPPLRHNYSRELHYNEMMVSLSRVVFSIDYNQWKELDFDIIKAKEAL